MVGTDEEKADLLRSLQAARDALLWKVEGLAPYDARRPLTPTGTNLLGLVKHVAAVESGYLGEVFGRPFPEPQPWYAEGAEPNADLWAAVDEPAAEVVARYRRVQAHADATVAALPLDARGTVPWWPPDRAEVTLHRVLVHLVAEVQRHAGHADVLRELVDGQAGLRPADGNLPSTDPQWWARQHDRLERIAREATA